jgi:hypothetical protein
MSERETRNAIKAKAFDKIESLILNYKYLNPDDVYTVMDEAQAALRELDEQAKMRNR